MDHNKPSITAALLALLFSLHSSSEPTLMGLEQEHLLAITKPSRSWVPDSDMSVIATFENGTGLPGSLPVLQTQYSERANFKQLVALLEGLAQWAKRPGWSHLYYDIERLQTHWNEQWKLESDADLKQRFIVSRANLLQQQHEFDRAIAWLQKISQQQSSYAQSLLMQARIYQISGQHKSAESICQKLLQSAGLYIAQLCFYDNPARLSNDQTIQTTLQRLHNNRSDLPIEVSRWQHRILGDMAMLNKDYQSAAQFYQFELSDAPLSQWLQWADAAIANKQSKQVRERLLALLKQHSNIEDSLLLRLVRAEKRLFGSSQWRQTLSNRIKLRQLRGDTEHTADLAYFFTFIEKDSKLAVHWAEMNWQRAKETADQRLLDAALLLESQS